MLFCFKKKKSFSILCDFYSESNICRFSSEGDKQSNTNLWLADWLTDSPKPSKTLKIEPADPPITHKLIRRH